jgi:hypothetical protein
MCILHLFWLLATWKRPPEGSSENTQSKLNAAKRDGALQFYPITTEIKMLPR